MSLWHKDYFELEANEYPNAERAFPELSLLDKSRNVSEMKTAINLPSQGHEEDGKLVPRWT